MARRPTGIEVHFSQTWEGIRRSNGALPPLSNKGVKALEAAGWRLSGKDGAAELLGLKYTTLQSRLQKLGLTRKP